MIKKAKREQNAKNLIQPIAICFFAITTAFAFLNPVLVFNWEANPLEWTQNRYWLMFYHLRRIISDMGVASAAFAGLLIWFYSKTLFSSESEVFKQSRGFTKINYSSLIFAFAISVALLIGESFRSHGSGALFTQNIFQMFFSLVFLIGWTAFFYVVTELAIYYLASAIKNPFSQKSMLNGKLADLLFEKRPFIAPFIFLLLAWFPIWFIRFPGYVQTDQVSMFSQFFGFWRLWDHHPLVAIQITGYLAQLGQLIFSENFNVSIFLVVLFQQLLSAAACAYALMTIRSWSIHKGVRMIALCFWAFFPWFPFSISQANLKDVGSGAFLLLFVVLYLDLIKRIKHSSEQTAGGGYYKQIIVITVSSIIFSLFRQANVYIIVLSLIPLAFIKQGIKFRLALILSGIIVFMGTNLINAGLRTALNAPRSISIEAAPFAIPIQQTARFLRDHPDEVTPEERAAIDAVWDFDRLLEVYRPDLAAHAFGTFRSSEGLTQYLYHWFRMGLRRPGTYIAATVANTYLYWTPTRGMPVFQWGWDYFRNHNTTGRHYAFHGAHPIVPLFPQEVRYGLRGFYWGINRLPGINMFSHLSTYTWLTLFFGLFLIRQDRKALLYALLPFLLSILYCIASPILGHQRYFLPLIMMMPMLVAWVVHAVQNLKASS